MKKRQCKEFRTLISSIYLTDLASVYIVPKPVVALASMLEMQSLVLETGFFCR